MSNESSYWMNLINIDNKNIIHYLIVGVVIVYIWFLSDISVKYIIPFIILVAYIILKQDFIYNKEKLIADKLLSIENNILKNKYEVLNKDKKMILFLEEIKIYHIYNPKLFKNFLESIEYFYIKRDIIRLNIVLELYQSFVFTIPINFSKDLYINLFKLKDILVSALDDTKAEMQIYIPDTYTIIDKNYGNYIELDTNYNNLINLNNNIKANL